MIPNKYSSDDVVFISDTHFNHTNIIKYCNRSFTTTEDMNYCMWTALENADKSGKIIIHLGDVGFFNAHDHLPQFRNRDKHILILGNHDKTPMLGKLKSNLFGTIIGSVNNWRTNQLSIIIDDIPVILSHNPLHPIPSEYRYNIHGHVHNNVFKDKTYALEHTPYLFNTDRYINVSVELTNYQPIHFRDALKLPTPK